MAARFLALAGLISIGFSLPANSQNRPMPCAPIDYALSTLEKHWGETPVEHDRALSGVVTIIRTENAQTGSYSILAVVGSTACLISEGQERKS